MYKVQKGLYVIAITVVLLCVWLVTAGSVVYAADESAIVLNLNNESNYGNASFEAKNMFPGDKVSNIYRVEISGLKNSDIATVYFQTKIPEGHEKLTEVLQCEVALAGAETVLYNGLMKDMPVVAELVAYNPATAYLDYEIRVWLDTSVGNEYQGKTLVADFIWWAEESRQRIEVASLDKVPEGLQNTSFNTIEKIKNELSRILITEGDSEYTMDNMSFYDVGLQFWNGKEWIDATEENFPLEGINVTLPYPEGTAKDTHDFTVSHMFTVDSDRLGIKAGEVEYPPVTKAEEGLNVTFKGLSPVAVTWKELETEENVPDVLPEDEVPEDDTSSNEASADDISANNPFTGDTAPIVKYICLMISTVCGLLWIICMIKRRKEYGDE